MQKTHTNRVYSQILKTTGGGNAPIKNKIMENFYNINTIVNANATEMVDNTKWISWSLNRLREGVPMKNLEKIARLITE